MVDKGKGNLIESVFSWLEIYIAYKFPMFLFLLF